MRMITLYTKSIYELHYVNINATLVNLGIVRHATLQHKQEKNLGVILRKELPALKTYKDTGR